MTVYSPGLEDSICISLVAGPSYVIDDFVDPAALERGANLSGDFVERLVPRDLFPTAFSTLASTAKWMHDALGIVNLIDCGRSLCAVTAT